MYACALPLCFRSVQSRNSQLGLAQKRVAATLHDVQYDTAATIQYVCRYFKLVLFFRGLITQQAFLKIQLQKKLKHNFRTPIFEIHEYHQPGIERSKVQFDALVQREIFPRNR